MDHEYTVREATPDPEAYIDLRRRAGLSPKTVEAAEWGLPNTLHGVVVYHRGSLVGMGRIVGDGGCFYQVVDVAVDPDHQGRGLGTEIMEELMAFVATEVPASAYVSLIADVEGFYERFGFEETRPDAKGMAMHVG